VTPTPTILFARLDATEVMEKLAPAPIKLETKPEVGIDDFSKLDIRVGKIIQCEAHPSAEKLLVSQVQIGPEVRQIVSGLAHIYKPEDLVGKKVTVIVNLKPVKLRGVISQGMLLVAEDSETTEILEVYNATDGSLIK